MGAALDIRGLKRVCASCGIRFYDLNKRPVICPECKTEFTGEIKLRARRGRVAAVEAEAPVAEADENIEQVEATDDVVSLEDVVEEGADDEEEDAMTLDDAEIDEEIEVDVEKE